jgi:hypothetical protein
MVLYGHRMEFRAAAATVIDSLTQAIDGSNVARSTIAHAADISVPELEDRLAYRADFTMLELVGIGGVLRIHPADLIGVTT